MSHMLLPWAKVEVLPNFISTPRRFGVMAVCWAPQPEDRPPLQELLACLEAFLTTLTAFI